MKPAFARAATTWRGALDRFVDRLRRGYQLVVGNRFKVEILNGAMPLLNRYLGNPLLSFIGRRLFASPVSRVKEFEALSITKTSMPSVGSATRERSALSIHASPRWDGMMTVNQGGCGCTQDFISPLYTHAA